MNGYDFLNLTLTYYIMAGESDSYIGVTDQELQLATSAKEAFDGHRLASEFLYLHRTEFYVLCL